jgi:hypothetical protein
MSGLVDGNRVVLRFQMPRFRIGYYFPKLG